MTGVDTNVLVRYLAQDDPVQSAQARRFIERQLSAAQPGHVAVVTLAELAWVLTSRYGATAAELADTVATLVADPRFVVQHADAVWLALEAVETAQATFTDALIAALDRRAGCARTVTFDRIAARRSGMTLLAA